MNWNNICIILLCKKVHNNIISFILELSFGSIDFSFYLFLQIADLSFYLPWHRI